MPKTSCYQMVGHAVVCILLLAPTKGYLPTTNTALDRAFLPFVRRLKDSWPDQSSNKQLVEKYRRQQRVQSTLAPSTAFFCENESRGNGTTFRSSSPPTSVHSLRPGDIDIIAAMGDSLTAANGVLAQSFPAVGFEDRGLSWSGGSTNDWRSYTTLPNIMRAFNPNLIGFSLPNSFSHQRRSHFNVAEVGAISIDIPHQARLLIKRLKADPRVDLLNSWKLITIMVGSNDFCVDMCYGGWRDLPERHRNDLHETFGLLKRELPRTLINFVQQPDLRLLLNLQKTPPLCYFLHLMLCPCLVGQQFSRIRTQLLKIMDQYIQVQAEVAADLRYRESDDFAIVMQPFTQGLDVPRKKNDPSASDMTFLGPDCFHLSQKGQAFAALGLWNNMMEPVGNKSRKWIEPWEKFICPTDEHPFIRTHRNSL